MAVPETPAVEAAIVRRLRAAGCVFAEEEAALLVAAAEEGSETGEEGAAADLETMVEQRVAGLPLEHILGWAEFCGLRIFVAPGVFVPRRRTELLVRQAADLAGERARASGTSAVIVDLCCGSGAIGAALAATLATIELYAADIDPAAVRSARRNLEPLGARVFEGDLFAPLPRALRGRVDILAVNAPYVPTVAIGMMPPEARLHEARVALDGGDDGLDVQRRVSAAASEWLAPAGHLLVEASETQAPVAAAIFAGNGLIPRIVHSDDLDSTVVIGTRPPD